MSAAKPLLRIVVVSFALAAAIGLITSVAAHAAAPAAGPVPLPCIPHVTCLPPNPLPPFPTPRPPLPPIPVPQPTATPTPEPSPTATTAPGPVPAPAPGLGRDMGLGSVVAFAAQGARWPMNQMVHWLNQPQPAGNWFIPIYQRMMTIGAVLMLPFLLLAIVDAVRHRDLGMLADSVAIKLPLAVVFTMIAVGLVQAGLSITDELTDYVLATPGVNLGAFFGLMAVLFGELAAAGAGMALSGFEPGAAVAFGAALAVLGAGVGIFVELIVRQAAIYATLLFLPLAFASTIWPSARGWTRKLVMLLFVAIVSKFVIAGIVVLGVAAFGSSVHDTGSLGDSGVQSTLIGAAMLVVAFSSPLALLRFLPMAEGMLAGWSGHARRAVSSVSTGGGSRLRALVRRGGASSRLPAAKPPARVARTRPTTTTTTPRPAPGRPAPTPTGGNGSGPGQAPTIWTPRNWRGPRPPAGPPPPYPPSPPVPRQPRP
jgi:hypothetical protein